MMNGADDKECEREKNASHYVEQNNKIENNHEKQNQQTQQHYKFLEIAIKMNTDLTILTWGLKGTDDDGLKLIAECVPITFLAILTWSLKSTDDDGLKLIAECVPITIIGNVKEASKVREIIIR